MVKNKDNLEFSPEDFLYYFQKKSKNYEVDGRSIKSYAVQFSNEYFSNQEIFNCKISRSSPHFDASQPNAQSIYEFIKMLAKNFDLMASHFVKYCEHRPEIMTAISEKFLQMDEIYLVNSFHDIGVKFRSEFLEVLRDIDILTGKKSNMVRDKSEFQFFRIAKLYKNAKASGVFDNEKLTQYFINKFGWKCVFAIEVNVPYVNFNTHWLYHDFNNQSSLKLRFLAEAETKLFVKLLKYNNQIEEISIWNCAGSFKKLEWLNLVPDLKKLVISSANNDQIACLIKNLKYAPNLKHLFLNGNYFDGQTILNLVKALKNHPSLVSLGLGGYPIGQINHIFPDLEDLVQQNSNMLFVDIGSSKISYLSCVNFVRARSLSNKIAMDFKEIIKNPINVINENCIRLAGFLAKNCESLIGRWPAVKYYLWEKHKIDLNFVTKQMQSPEAMVMNRIFENSKLASKLASSLKGVVLGSELYDLDDLNRLTYSSIREQILGEEYGKGLKERLIKFEEKHKIVINELPRAMVDEKTKKTFFPKVQFNGIRQREGMNQVRESLGFSDIVNFLSMKIETISLGLMSIAMRYSHMEYLQKNEQMQEVISKKESDQDPNISKLNQAFNFLLKTKIEPETLPAPREIAGFAQKISHEKKQTPAAPSLS